MLSLQTEADVLASKVTADTAGLQIALKDGREFFVPFAGWPSLASASYEERTHFEVIGDGEGIHWPDINEDLSIRGLYRDFAQVEQRALSEVPYLIADLYRITRKLNDIFPGRPFTPDGHLMGSIGEVVAEYVYDLHLERCSTPQIDARTKDAKQTVQIKLTGEHGKSYGFRWSSAYMGSSPDHLICLKLTTSGFEEVYAGRFPAELLTGRNDSSNGQLAISLSKLKSLNPSSLPQVHPLDQLNSLFRKEFETAA